VFSGPEDLVEVVLKACRQGPRGAVVERVEQLDSDESSVDPSGRFEVRETV
jgi:acylphosphatase